MLKVNVQTCESEIFNMCLSENLAVQLLPGSQVTLPLFAKADANADVVHLDKKQSMKRKTPLGVRWHPQRCSVATDDNTIQGPTANIHATCIVV